MADYFVKHTGSDADGLTWATAKITLAGALALAVGGDRIFVASTHVESAGATKTLTSAGSNANPVQVYSVSDGSSNPSAVLVGGTVTTTGSTNIVVDGSIIFHGLNFNAGQSFAAPAATSGDVIQIYNNCAITTVTTATSNFVVGSGASTNASRGRLMLNNCNVKLTAALGRFQFNQEFSWRGGTYQGSATQTHLIRSGAQGRGVPVVIEGVDFTAMGVGTHLVSGASATGRIMFRNCLLPAGWTGSLIEGAPDPGLRVELHNCDSADTNYRMSVAAFSGTIRTETAMVKSSGASDGTTPVSWKVETNANPNPGQLGLESNEFVRWNTTAGTPVTVTVDILPDSGTLTTAEVWLDIQYLGTSGSPKSVFLSTRPAPLASGTALATSSAVWPNGGARTPQKLVSAPFTPDKAGAIHCKVVVAKPNTVVYVDPKIQVS